MELYLVLAIAGLVGGFLAGWVGLGGGIIIAPLLLYLPWAIGLNPLDMKEVARCTILQSLCSTAAAGVAHRRLGQMHGRLVMWMGAIIAVASLGGAFVSELHFVTPELLLGVLAAMALVASVLMFRCSPEDEHDITPAADAIQFSHLRAAGIALGVGLLGGMVGQSGAFLTIPLLIHVLRIPTRLAIGSSLGITFCAALAGSLGKFFGGGSVVWTQVAVLVAGSLVGAQLGSALSRRAAAPSLRFALAVLIGLSAVRMWFQAIG